MPRAHVKHPQVATSEIARGINRGVLPNLIRRRQSISRAALADVTGLQRSTVSTSFIIPAKSQTSCESLSRFLRICQTFCDSGAGKGVGPEQVAVVQCPPNLSGDLVLPNWRVKLGGDSAA
jgi:hypothetical protein